MSTASPDVLRELVQSYRDEYAEVSDRWKSLDAKSQGVGAFAGILLSACLALSKAAGFTLSGLEASVLIFAVVALMAAIFTAMMALRIRSIQGAPMGTNIAQMLQDMAHATHDSDSECIRRYYGALLRNWRTANFATNQHLTAKACWVAWSQRSAALSSLIVGSAAVVSIWRML